MAKPLKIFIGYDQNSNPISILMADSREKADIAWMGMNDSPVSVEEIDPQDDLGIHGIVFVLTSIEANSRSDYGHRANGVDFRIWKRGR